MPAGSNRRVATRARVGELRGQPERDIDAIPIERQDLVREQQLDRHLGELGSERRQQRPEQLRGHPGRGRDPQVPSRDATGVTHHRGRVREELERSARAFPVQQAGFGRGDCPPAPLQQRDPQPGLEAVDAAAHGPLPFPHLPRRSSDGPEVDHPTEGRDVGGVRRDRF
jgi:hypothetical protein